MPSGLPRTVQVYGYVPGVVLDSISIHSQSEISLLMYAFLKSVYFPHPWALVLTLPPTSHMTMGIESHLNLF